MISRVQGGSFVREFLHTFLGPLRGTFLFKVDCGLGFTFGVLFVPELVLALIVEATEIGYEKGNGMSLENFKKGRVPFNNLCCGAVLGHGAS